MSQIQTGRYSDLLRRFLGMKGVTDVSAELSPEISPILVLETERPEWEFLKNEKLMSAVFALGGVVAENTVFRLRNPTGSGVVAVIARIEFSTDATTAFIVERDDDNGNLATVTPTVSRDTRLPVLNASVLVASGDTNVVLSGESWLTGRTIANVTNQFPAPFVLTAGNEIDIASIATNVVVRGFVHWRERRLDAMEEEV